MREAEALGCIRPEGEGYPPHQGGATSRENLLRRNLTTTEADGARAADTTHVFTAKGGLYLAFTLDVYVHKRRNLTILAEFVLCSFVHEA